MKGIIIAAGEGTRLRPIAGAKPLQLLYQTPMIYHPITSLMEAGIRDILIIVSKTHLEDFKRDIGDGSQWGINIRYDIQEKQIGIPDAFNIGASFIGDDTVCLALGDNVFIGEAFTKALSAIPTSFTGGALNFCLPVKDARAFGVYKFAEDSETVLDIVEKPSTPPSKFASVGLYVFDSRAVAYTKTLEKSARGELEIPDLMKKYLSTKELRAVKLDSSIQWHDAGNADSNLAAAVDLQTSFKSGYVVGSPEIAALKKGWISPENLIAHYEKNRKYFKSEYYMAVENFAKAMQAKNEKSLTAFSFFSSSAVSASAPSSPIPGSQATTPTLPLSPNM